MGASVNDIRHEWEAYRKLSKMDSSDGGSNSSTDHAHTMFYKQAQVSKFYEPASPINSFNSVGGKKSRPLIQPVGFIPG